MLLMVQYTLSNVLQWHKLAAHWMKISPDNFWLKILLISIKKVVTRTFPCNYNVVENANKELNAKSYKNKMLNEKIKIYQRAIALYSTKYRYKIIEDSNNKILLPIATLIIVTKNTSNKIMEKKT